MSDQRQPDSPEPTKTTVQLRGGDMVRTPSGDRTGYVARVFRGGLMNDQRGRTTVKFLASSVHSTTGEELSGLRSWVTEPDDAVWTLIDPWAESTQDRKST